MPKLYIGLIVHFVDESELCRAAIVVRTFNADEVSLVVFRESFAAGAFGRVAQSTENKVGTWHFIEE